MTRPQRTPRAKAGKLTPAQDRILGRCVASGFLVLFGADLRVAMTLAQRGLVRLDGMGGRLAQLTSKGERVLAASERTR